MHGHHLPIAELYTEADRIAVDDIDLLVESFWIHRTRHNATLHVVNFDGGELALDAQATQPS